MSYIISTYHTSLYILYSQQRIDGSRVLIENVLKFGIVFLKIKVVNETEN